jgi:hypothetical protein
MPAANKNYSRKLFPTTPRKRAVVGNNKDSMKAAGMAISI